MLITSSPTACGYLFPFFCQKLIFFPHGRGGGVIMYTHEIITNIICNKFTEQKLYNQIIFPLTVCQYIISIIYMWLFSLSPNVEGGKM